MAERRRNRKWIIGVVILILAVVGVALAVVRPWEKREVVSDGGVSTEAVVKTVEVLEPEQEPEPEKVDEVVEKEEVKQYEGSDPNAAEGLTGAVTYVGVSGDYLMIRVNIDQYLSSGTCRLVLNRMTELAYTETVAVADAAATSTCEGFNVPLSKLATMNYNIIVYVDAADGRSGEIYGEVRL